MQERKKLIDIFLEINSQVNLSAIRDAEWVYTKHILDSLEANKFMEFKKWDKILDIGTGGGFPLMPLAITNPDANFTGIDARRKKVDSVNKMLEHLWVNNAKAEWGRIEEHKGKYDCITSRAVWYVDKLIPRSYKLLKKWGLYVFFKQVDMEEKTDLMALCHEKNMELVWEHIYKLFDDDIERVIYIVQKN